MFLLCNKSNYFIAKTLARQVLRSHKREPRKGGPSCPSPPHISAPSEGGRARGRRGAGSPENEALGPLLLEKPVKGSLGAGEDVRRQGGAGLARAAEVQLRHLPSRAGGRHRWEGSSSPPPEHSWLISSIQTPGKPDVWDPFVTAKRLGNYALFSTFYVFTVIEQGRMFAPSLRGSQARNHRAVLKQSNSHKPKEVRWTCANLHHIQCRSATCHFRNVKTERVCNLSRKQLQLKHRRTYKLLRKTKMNLISVT